MVLVFFILRSELCRKVMTYEIETHSRNIPTAVGRLGNAAALTPAHTTVFINIQYLFQPLLVLIEANAEIFSQVTKFNC